MIWELIKVNKRKSIFLMMLMAVVLMSLGALIGYAFGAQQGMGIGILAASGLFLILAMTSFAAGDQIMLASCGAQEITKEMNPQLFNVVEEMTIAAQLPKMPKVYIIPDKAPNAFATGRNPEHASVAVTAGLLARLNRDELQGVIAHEISHIIHRDVLYVTLAGIMVGTIVMLSDLFMRTMFWGSVLGSRRRYSSRSDQGGGQIVVLAIAILAAILAPIFAYVLYFSLSRRREYLADAGAARLTRYPEGLASALEKISSAHIPMESANKVTAPMYIAPPMKKDRMAFAGLGHTHPPIEERVKVLREMVYGASYKDYSNAFTSVTGSKTAVPKSALADSGVQIRSASKEGAKPLTQKQQMHQAGDIIRMVNGFAMITCSCGLKLKVPPNFKRSTVNCPRCKKELTVNKAG